jgi:hypothetical protein
MSPRLVLPSPPGEPSHHPAAPAPARVAASVLLAASRMLDRVAGRLVAAPAVAAPSVLPSLEFHAEAGAPEGALYVDGELVAYLPGVTRL